LAGKMTAIRYLTRSQFVARSARSDLPGETHGAEIGLDLPDKRQTAHGDTLGPSAFPDLPFGFERIFNPDSMKPAQWLAAADAKQLHPCLPVNQPVALWCVLSLSVAAMRLLGGVPDDSGPDPIQVHGNDTQNEMAQALRPRMRTYITGVVRRRLQPWVGRPCSS
jgi:hypothetical protein